MAVPVVVAHLSVLEAGDHIKWKRLKGYDHHAIVESVDHESGQIRVIEYGSDNEGYSFGKGVVRKTTVHGVEGMDMYVYGESDDTHEVLQRAMSRLGEREYDPFTNNCEHFARWCKTGQGCCTQVISFIKRVCVWVAESGSGMYLIYRGSDVELLTAELEKQTAGSTICNICKQVLKIICAAIANGDIDVVAVLYLIELMNFICSWHKARKTYKDAIQRAKNDYERKIFERERNRYIKEAGGKSALAVAGTATGALLGSWFPVVGTGYGAAIGYTVGRLGGIVLF